jgi:hypothetical protein
VKFADAIDNFLHLVPGCPRFEAIEAIRFAVIEFCTKGLVQTGWVAKTTADLTFSTTTPAESPSQVVGLFDAWVGGKQVKISHINSSDLELADANNVYLVHQADLNTTLALDPPATELLSVSLLIATAPTPDANEFADSLWMMHREALRHGALARLLSDPGTPYANEGRAADYRQKFLDAITDASAQASVNRVTGSQRLRVTPR